MARISDVSFNAGGMSLYVGSPDDDATEQMRLSFVTPNLSAWADLEIDEAIHLRKVLADSIREYFMKNPETRCPACGYTMNDAALHGDHRNCRQYPYFPYETGKSKAVEI